MSALETIDGFVVLKVKYKPNSSVVRDVFVKEHVCHPAIPEKPNARTLLAINLPPFVDDFCVRHLFGNCGKIVNIFFQSQINPLSPTVRKSQYFDRKDESFCYKVCYVVFTSAAAVKNAVHLSQSSKVLAFRPNEDSEKHLVGLKAMKKSYNETIISMDDMQKEINQFMEIYDQRVEKEKTKARELDGVPDEEGWIKVTKYSKKRHLANSLANDSKIVEKHNKRRKKSQNELQNFYKFQMKDKKFENLKQLKQRFEDDKKKLMAMKAQRKFRPV